MATNKASEVAVLSYVPEATARAVIYRLTGSKSLQWHISNKYYKATVQFKLYSSLPDLLQQAEGSPAVLVLASSLDQIPAIGEIAWEGLDVGLVIRVDLADPPVALLPTEEDAWLAKCMEADLEFVDVCAKSEAEDGDFAEGLSRANEALQTHRWPSAGLDQEVSAAPSPQSAGFDDDFSPFQHASDDDHFHEDHDDPLASFDQFASILLSLQTMRQHALSLPEDARRAFAEDASSKVADVLSGRPTRGPPCVDR